METPYYRAGEVVTSFEGLAPLQQPELLHTEGADNAAPQFDIWYGTAQSFGRHGTPQEWINVLGNVHDPDGIGDLRSLYFTLNGDPVARPLSYGGVGTSNSFNKNDGRRLWREGDFNVEIDKAELLDGPNTIAITAVDSQGNSTAVYVTVDYDPNADWPVNYATDWSSATSIQDHVQVVDGKWKYSANGVRTVETGYDRILAIGEGSFAEGGWQESEVTAEVTIHGYDAAGFDQVAPAVGIVARWQGHTDYKYSGCQPKCGWLPVGAVAWYSWRSSGARVASMWSNESGKYVVRDAPTMAYDTTYYWKLRAENLDSASGTYYWKIWQKGTAEPAG